MTEVQDLTLRARLFRVLFRPQLRSLITSAEEKGTIMAKREALSAGIDLKQFFEASVSALQDDSKIVDLSSCTPARKRALVQRTAPGEIRNRRALADAAKALTTLWNMQTSTRAV